MCFQELTYKLESRYLRAEQELEVNNQLTR